MRNKEEDRVYYHKNKERIAIQRKRRYTGNKESLNVKRREYCARNREHINSRQRKYGKEWRLAQSIIWKQAKSLCRYSITIIQWLQIYDAQEGRCAICGKTGKNILDTAAGNRKTEILHTDHCHESGRVRGLLCEACNRGLGFFNDSERGLENAINYLKYFASERSGVQHEQKRALPDADIGTVLKNRLPLPTMKLLKNVNLI